MSYRVLLSDDVVPSHYDLALEPDLKRFTYEGVVKIDVEVHVATDVVTVHARELAIVEASFMPTGGDKALDSVEIAFRPKDQTAAFKFEQPLPTGTGTLTVKFSGTLNDQMAGFYRSQYVRANGQTAHLAVTQFEAIDARRCFPCWDEPARKATFTITLTVPSDLTALSNMPESRVEYLPGGNKKVSFLETPKMSTYLVAVLVGELESIQHVTSQGVLVRILSTPGRIAQCEYALSCGVRALEFYDKFFGVPFPLPKVDMVAIPDFASGAMENWGLVTYRETSCLCDEATASVSSKQNVQACITHELAHQWFGNLVTMRWWDDLWLNEGFANWTETFCADSLTPEWKMWENFVGGDQQLALALDALRTSHPIQVPIAHAREVEEVFDNISYSKGGSLVRMLFAVLGRDNFQKGLQIYFKRHAYGNTETHDLAKAWEEASGLPIKELLDSWTKKMGYPVLKVLTDPFEANGTLEVEQQWFLADGSVQPKDAEVTWMIPVLLGSDSAKVSAEVTLHKEKKISMKVPVEGAKWLKLNSRQQILCRVSYPPSLFKRLAANLPSLPAEDRIGLLSDVNALSRAGHADPAQLVDLLKGLKEETSDKVWAQMGAILREWNRFIVVGLPEPVGVAFNKFAAGLVHPTAKALGWDHRPEDEENTKALRQIIIGLVALFCFDEPEVKEEGKKRLEALLTPGSSLTVSDDTRCSVLRIAIRGDKTTATFDKLVALHNSTTDQELRSDIYAALAWAPPALQTKALEWILTGDVKAQDMTALPSGISVRGREGPDVVFNWTKAQYAGIERKLGRTSMILFTRIIRSSGEGFMDAAKAAEVQKFWEGQAVFKTGARTVQQTCEAIATNAQVLGRLKASALAKEEFWATATA
jgi:puromycin-sensitive aminopeptidase